MPQGNSSNSQPFFSLKWKAVLVFSLVLIVVNAGLAGLGYLQLKEQFVLQQEQLRQQQIHQLQALIDTSFSELELIASMIPTMVPADFQTGSMSKQLLSVFKEQTAILEFDWGLDGASFYAPDNRLLFSWRPSERLERFQTMIQEANDKEQPVYQLDCLDQCRQVVAVPILRHGAKTGVLLLSRLIADVIISLKDITNADIAIISQTLSGANSRLELRFLPQWQRHVVALTQPDINMPLLLGAATKHRFEELLVAAQEIQANDGFFALQSLQISPDEANSATHFIIINDITQAVMHLSLIHI